METSSAYSELAVSLFNLIPSSKIRKDTALGITDELANRLSEITLSDIRCIASRADRFLSIRVDISALEQTLADLARHKKETALQDEYLCNQATYTMMRDLFGMHTTEFSSRRKLLGLAGKGQHRPQYCDEKTEIMIWKVWEQFGDLELRERYLKVAKTTGLPLNIIRPAIDRNKE